MFEKRDFGSACKFKSTIFAEMRDLLSGVYSYQIIDNAARGVTFRCMLKIQERVNASDLFQRPCRPLPNYQVTNIL